MEPTAIYCQGTAALVDLKLADGSYLKAFVVRDGRLITGQQRYSGRKAHRW